jgi:peptidoglycan/xylan/chitin deacetylase (PgdA/CDA1 family)
MTPDLSMRLSRAAFLRNSALVLGGLMAMPMLPYGASAQEPTIAESWSPEEAESWHQRISELNSDPEVKSLRSAAAKIKKLKTRRVRIEPGAVPDDGNLEQGQIALTFDDGPTPINTKLILQALAAERLHATFFHIGSRADKHPELSKLVKESGHMVGSHTMHHPYLNKLEESIAHTEIISGRESIDTATGGSAPFFRFPYGESTPELMAFITNNGLAAFKWNMAAYDWKFEEDYYGSDLRRLLKGIMKELDRAGKGIMLMHDRTCTALVLPDVLNYMKVKGIAHVQFLPTT